MDVLCTPVQPCFECVSDTSSMGMRQNVDFTKALKDFLYGLGLGVMNDRSRPRLFIAHYLSVSTCVSGVGFVRGVFRFFVFPTSFQLWRSRQQHSGVTVPVCYELLPMTVTK